ncbi:hypothetical protein, partial [Rhodoblastus sp.]|uniref:hypothetical protein n=1 Tax=Rhodoblastus sp. TaxID=1962975 RepID=UPI003F996CBD
MNATRFRTGATGFIALLWLSAWSGAALAQANSLEESGIGDKRGEPAVIDDKAFDCAAFRQIVAAAPDGFKTLRGAVTKDAET